MSVSLNIATFNLENLFIKEVLPEYENPHFFKSIEKVEALKLVFNDIDADIYALQEIGFIESLVYFNEKYLGSKYEVFHKKGNSSRNIEIAFLVKKETLKEYELNVELINHYKQKIESPYTEDEVYYLEQKGFKDNFKLSRNLLELSLIKDNSHIASLFNCHLKSARDETGLDFKSNKRRKSELELCVKIIENQARKLSVFLGDFNGNASANQTEKEFSALYEHGYQDVLKRSDYPLEYRATFFAFSKKKRVPIQLDYAFLKEENLKYVSSPMIYRFKNDLGRPRPFPKSRYDVLKSPSDHYPLVFTLEIPPANA